MFRPLQNVPPLDKPDGSYGRCALKSNGKDTTTGHWEMAGIILEQAFPTYPNGFPPSILDRFINETGVPGVLGNFAASGPRSSRTWATEHVDTGKPIVYTSADSVFQIAAHEEIIPLDRLYEICETAREHTRWRTQSRTRDRAAVSGRARKFLSHREPSRLCRAAAARKSAAGLEG